MKTFKLSRLKEDARDIPDGQIFMVYTEQKASPFKKTENKPNLWAFAFKMKGKTAVSSWKLDTVSKAEMTKSMKQIAVAKGFGWSNTRVKDFNDVGEKGDVYECLYCDRREVLPEGPCPCRGVPEPKKSVIDFL